MNKKESSISGNYNSEQGRIIRIKLRKCVNETETGNYCKPEEEIKEFFRGKYFLTL